MIFIKFLEQRYASLNVCRSQYFRFLVAAFGVMAGKALAVLFGLVSLSALAAAGFVYISKKEQNQKRNKKEEQEEQERDHSKKKDKEVRSECM